MTAAPPAVGDQIPPLELLVDLGVAVRACAIQWAFPPFLYDDAAAQALGMPGAMLVPEYKASLMARAVEEWLAGRGWVSRVRAAHRRPVVIGDRIRIEGVVAAVAERPDGGLAIDLEVNLLGADGAPASRGFASAVIERRGMSDEG